MVHPLGSAVLIPGTATGRVPVIVSVATAAGSTDLVVELSDDPDPTDALAAVAAIAGSSRLVVDRTGTPVRGAVVGRDLLTGDRLVAPTHRTAPALCALTGPLRGARAVVDRELLIGRGGRFGDRTVHDTEVSRHHLRVTPTPGGLAVTELGSTNGTLLEGRPLQGTAILRAGDRIEVGGSVLVVLGDPPRGAHLRSRDGTVAYDVPTPSAPDGAVPGPAPGTDPPTDAPADPGRRRWRGRRRPPTASPEDARAHVARTEERTPSGDRHPDPASVAAAIAGWSDRLWERVPGHPADGTVRIGEALAHPHPAPATSPAATSGAAPEGTGVHGAALAGPGERCVVDLWADREVAIVGPPGATAEHVAAWVLHLAALQHPAHLSLSISPAPGSTALLPLVAAARWLPHVGMGAPRPRPPVERSVAFVEVGPRGPATSPAGPGATGAGPASTGGTTVWVARSRHDLPHPCPTVVEVDDDGTAAAWGRHGHPDRRLLPDLVAGPVTDALTRLLAPLVTVEAGSDHAR